MTTYTDIVNRALQTIGTRTTVTSAELTNNSSNEAIQANLVLYNIRDELLRMAPWDCAFNTNLLQYITSTPGTIENPAQQLQTWTKGQPSPPWAYEYMYPADCLRACWVVPQFNTGYTSGVPITTAVTGGSPSFWNGPPIRFKVAIDQFFSISSAVVVNGGTGYAVGDLIYLAPGSYSPSNLPTANPPIGGPGVLQVTAAPAGIVSTVSIVNTFAQAQPENDESRTGAYFLIQANPMAQSTTSGSGTGATFTCTFASTAIDQRVILTNQEFAILNYVKQCQDPNIFDPLFLDAYIHVLGARLVIALTGDKALANQHLAITNNLVTEARKVDGNEGLTVNDVTPDWIRGRGIAYSGGTGPYSMEFDWGNMFTPY